MDNEQRLGVWGKNTIRKLQKIRDHSERKEMERVKEYQLFVESFSC